MAATLLQISDLYEGGNALFSRVVGACVKAAWAIIYEDAGTSNHANRIVWANDILTCKANAVVRANRIFGLILSNATIQTAGEASTDNDIEFVVNGFIDTVATGE